MLCNEFYFEEFKKLSLYSEEVLNGSRSVLFVQGREWMESLCIRFAKLNNAGGGTVVYFV